MGLVGLAKPVGWHSSRVHSMNTTALTHHQLELISTRFRNWYSADWDYGLTTIYFFCAAIGVFTLANLFALTRKKKINSTHGALTKLTALSRYLRARQYYVKVFNWYSPSLGAISIVATIIIFVLGLSFAVRPYYWPNPAMGNSPPLGTRTGWISIAIMPFMFAFASKVNFIGILAGTTHEKLQVYHRWAAWIMYLTSLLHTFPFIVWNIKLGQMTLFYQKKSYYWTGVAALIPQTWLVLMSWGPIRSRYYETFKKLHFLASIVFMGFLWLHCNWRLTSWDYFWATAAIFGLAWVIRFGRMFIINGLTNKATLEVVGDRMVKVHVPTKLKWKPGQHFFVRFTNTGVHVLTSHPFTVASLSTTGVMEFLIRPQDGLTGRLAALADSNKPSTVLLDGPYGGIHKELTCYETVMLVAGGSGASFTIPILLDLVERVGRDKTRRANIIFVWAVKASEAVDCYRDVFDALESKGGDVRVAIHVTGGGHSATPSEDGDDKKSGLLETHSGRPDIPGIIHHAFSEASSLSLTVCGPETLTLDARNAVAECQLAILGGGTKCKDLYLHAEPYSW